MNEKGVRARVSKAYSLSPENIEFISLKGAGNASAYLNKLVDREREKMEKFNAAREQLARGRKAQAVADPYGGVR